MAVGVQPAAIFLRPSRPALALAGGFVAGVDDERAAIGFGGLDLVALLFIGQPQASPGVGVAVIDIERGVIVLDRQVVFAGDGQALGTRLIGGCGEGIAVDGVVEVGDRLGMVAVALVDEPTRMEGGFRRMA